MNFLQELRNFSLAHVARNSEEAIVEAMEKLHAKISEEVHNLVDESLREYHAIVTGAEKAVGMATPPVPDTPPSPPVAPPAPVEIPAAAPVPEAAPSASGDVSEETPKE